MEDLENRIDHHFADEGLVITALTHSSYRNESRDEDSEDYERLEFLGDAVLELTVSDHLFRTRTGMKEGEMTSLRASLVCEPTLALCAREIGLQSHILLGKGEDRQGSRNKDSILSDVFEALIGAIYLDAGIEEARRFVSRFVLDDLENKIMFRDCKTELQNHAQKYGLSLEYATVKEEGPEHAKHFTVACLLSGKEAGRGEGTSKKSAEQHAAYAVLKKLREE